MKKKAYPLALLLIGTFLILFPIRCVAEGESVNLVKNGSFEEGGQYWEGDEMIQNRFENIILEGPQTFPAVGMPKLKLDSDYLDQPITIQYHPEKMKGALFKSTVFFEFFDTQRSLRSRLTYLLSGTANHWEYVNQVVDGVSYITVEKNRNPIGRVSEVTFENILEDQNRGALKIGARPLRKGDIGTVEIRFATWFNQTGSVRVTHDGWNQYIKSNIQFINLFKNKILLQKPLINQVHHLPPDGQQYLALKVPLTQKVIYRQTIPTEKGRQYLLMADARVKTGANAPEIHLINPASQKTYLTAENDLNLARTGWTRWGGIFKAESKEVSLQLIALNNKDEYGNTVTGEPDSLDYVHLTARYDYDNVRLIELPEFKERKLKKWIEKAFDVELKDRKIKPKILDYKKRYPEDFYEKLEQEYDNLGLPIYDLYFDENKLYAGSLEEMKSRQSSAVFRHQGRDRKVRIKVRGEMLQHFNTATRSLRIDFKSGDSFNGKKRINLLRPMTRDYFNEQYHYFIAQKFGLVTPDNRLIFLRVNDRPYGMMYEIEQLSKELLETNQKPVGDLYNDEVTLGYIYRKNSPDFWDKYTKDPYARKWDKINVLLLVHFMNLDFFEGFKALVDMESLIRWNAHAIVTGTTHQSYTVNNRLYFNNTAGAFEFLPWDTKFPYYQMGNQRYNPLVDFALKDIAVFDSRNDMLWEYLKNEKNLQEDSRYYQDLWDQVKPALLATQHYSWKGEWVTDLFFVQELIRETYSGIKPHRDTISSILKSATPIQVTYRGQDSSNPEEADASLVTMTLEPLNDRMFSSGLLQSITVNSGFLNRRRVALYQDDGDQIFNEKKDKCLLACEGIAPGNTFNLNETIPSKFQYEKYVNTPPFNIIGENFLKLIKVPFLAEDPAMLHILHDVNYIEDSDSKEKNYTLRTVEVSNPDIDALEAIFKKAGYTPNYRKLTFFIKGDVSLSELLNNIRIRAVNKVTGDELKVDYGLAPKEAAPPTSPPPYDIDFSPATFETVFSTLQKNYPDNVDLTPYQYLPLISATEDQFAQRYPFFVKDESAKAAYHLPAGIHRIKETIIIPKGITLIIEPGATLKFSPKTSLIAYGKIKAVGTPEKPVTFTSLPLRSWGVVGLVRQDSGGEFEHCVFENGGEARVNGVYFSGMLSAYHTNAAVKNCVFRGAGRGGGDDALNFKNGLFTVEDSLFEKNRFDAIDFDFAEKGSVIQGNTFLKNGNDGLDISGSDDIQIIQNHIRKSGDKCISIGEKTNGMIRDNRLVDCNFGIAVKDSSSVGIVQNQFQGNRVGVAAYNKKPIFGGGQVSVYNSVFENNAQDFGIEVIGPEDSRFQDEVYQSDGVVYNSEVRLSDAVTREVIREPKKKTITKKQVLKDYILGNLDRVGYQFAVLVNRIREGDPAENPYLDLPITID